MTELVTRADVDSFQTLIRKDFRDLKMLLAAKVVLVLGCALMLAISFLNELEATFAEARQMTSVQPAAPIIIQLQPDD
jgi:hypothetical protein